MRYVNLSYPHGRADSLWYCVISLLVSGIPWHLHTPAIKLRSYFAVGSNPFVRVVWKNPVKVSIDCSFVEVKSTNHLEVRSLTRADSTFVIFVDED